jgi:hypothetical protein
MASYKEILSRTTIGPVTYGDGLRLVIKEKPSELPMRFCDVAEERALTEDEVTGYLVLLIDYFLKKDVNCVTVTDNKTRHEKQYIFKSKEEVSGQ